MERRLTTIWYFHPYFSIPPRPLVRSGKFSILDFWPVSIEGGILRCHQNGVKYGNRTSADKTTTGVYYGSLSIAIILGLRQEETRRRWQWWWHNTISALSCFGGIFSVTIPLVLASFLPLDYLSPCHYFPFVVMLALYRLVVCPLPHFILWRWNEERGGGRNLDGVNKCVK